MDTGEVLKVISEPTRFKIVQLLLKRHHCSRSISKTLGISESAVSQHMALLKRAGVVTSYRHGYHIHYVLNPETIQGLIDSMQDWLAQMAQIRDCHEFNPCAFVLGDGSNGCLYRSSAEEVKAVGFDSDCADQSDSAED